jgi:hypothetical protein
LAVRRRKDEKKLQALVLVFAPDWTYSSIELLEARFPHKIPEAARITGSSPAELSHIFQL